MSRREPYGHGGKQRLDLALPYPTLAAECDKLVAKASDSEAKRMLQ